MNCSNLPFPLSLLATVLKLEYGQVELLTYGCYPSSSSVESSSIPINEAQLRLARQLISRIQSQHNPRLTILVLGDTQCYIANRLSAAGHDVINPDPVGMGFDVVVLEGSFGYEQQLELFSRARHLIRKQGRLLFVSEFINDDSEIAYSSLANLSSCRQLALRLGFDISAETDFSADAQQFLQALLTLANKHSDGLLKELAIPESRLQQHIEVLQQHIAEYASNRRNYRFFEMTYTGDSETEYADAEYGDIDSFQTDEVSQLFEKSFNVPFDDKVWDWKYNLGAGRCVVARDKQGGEVVAHYGGAPRQILYFGKQSMAIQVCDVMVLPEKRLHYGKNSLFFKVAATFLEREIGNTVKHLLGFGFPNQKAMNIALRLGLYEKTDDFVEVLIAPASDSGFFALIPLDIAAKNHQQQVNALWQAMAKGLVSGIVGVRDWQYLKYRYFDHPFASSGQYQCFLLQEKATDQALAVLVFKQHEERLLLMDIICGESNMLPAITAANETLNAGKMNENQQQIKIWITKGWQEAVMPVGATINELKIEIPCNSWNPGPDAASLYGAWWLTAGDMDFM